MASGQQKLLRAGGVGFFDKALDGVRSALPCQRATLLDVAIACAGKCGLHTKHDDGACLGGNNARADGGGKGGGIGDVVVCGQKQQQGI